jgi:hypothetical protein
MLINKIMLSFIFYFKNMGLLKMKNIIYINFYVYIQINKFKN